MVSDDGLFSCGRCGGTLKAEIAQDVIYSIADHKCKETNMQQSEEIKKSDDRINEAVEVYRMLNNLQRTMNDLGKYLEAKISGFTPSEFNKYAVLTRAIDKEN